MSIKENIVKIAKSVEDGATKAANTVAKKSGEVYEMSKLTLNLATAEGNKEDLLRKVGEIVYDLHEEGTEVSPLLVDKLYEVQLLDEKIKGIKNKLKEIKNIKECFGCGAKVKQEDKFCSKCGDQLPEDIVDDTLDETVDEASSTEETEGFYEAPSSDSEDDVCGPLNCDKEL